jgi:hypothetical protein
MGSTAPPASLVIRVRPRSAANRVGPWRNGILIVDVTRPAAGGEATGAALRAVADALRVAPTAVRLVAGGRTRQKRLSVAGLTPTELSGRLSTLDPRAD